MIYFISRYGEKIISVEGFEKMEELFEECSILKESIISQVY